MRRIFSSPEYPTFTMSAWNVIIFSRSQEEPLTLLGVASTPVLGVLSAGSDGLVRRVAPAPGPVIPVVLPAVTPAFCGTLNSWPYRSIVFSKLCKRYFFRRVLGTRRNPLSLSVFRRLGTQVYARWSQMGAGGLSLLI